jgi:16S rRNA processing protein RimM
LAVARISISSIEASAGCRAQANTVTDASKKSVPSAGQQGLGQSEALRVGRVARAHGLKGELEVRLDWEEGEGLLDAREVELEAVDGRRSTHAVKRARATPKGVLVQLEGIADRTAAEARLGNVVSVARAELPELDEGEYYLADLVGVVVSGPEGFRGRVVEVQMYPSVDAIVIETASGERFEQPLIDEWIERVDIAGEGVVLRSEGGLIEGLGRPAARREPPGEG